MTTGGTARAQVLDSCPLHYYYHYHYYYYYYYYYYMGVSWFNSKIKCARAIPRDP